MDKDLQKDLSFIVELEKMKEVFRRTMIIGSDRRENDAEHSWHISVMAMLLSSYNKDKIDTNHAIKMLLIHDIIEIYAGDTFAYDKLANLDKNKRELDAMEQIKLQLSSENAETVESLWKEFEAKESPESKFANAMDRLQPVLSNIYSRNGGTWLKYGVKFSQVLKRIEPIRSFNSEIYDFLMENIEKALTNGYILED